MSDNQEVTLCVNCRYCEFTPYDYEQYYCTKNSTINLVDGTRELNTAKDSRIYEEKCGRSARWFEPAPKPEPMPQAEQNPTVLPTRTTTSLVTSLIQKIIFK